MATLTNSYTYCTHGAPYLPWANFFRKVAASDVLVILDDVQMPMGRSLLNRCNVIIGGAERVLSVPIARSKGSGILRCEVEIVETDFWKRKHLETFRHLYGDSPYWPSTISDILDLLSIKWTHLMDMNIALIQQINKLCQIDTQIVRASSLKILEKDPTGRIVALGRALGATKYISGQGARAYLSEATLAHAGIDICYQAPITISPQPNGWTDRGLTCIDEISRFGVIKALGKDIGTTYGKNS